MKDVMLSTRARAAVRLALDEDLADALDARKSKWCDATSEALVDPKAVATGEIYAKGRPVNHITNLLPGNKILALKNRQPRQI